MRKRIAMLYHSLCIAGGVERVMVNLSRSLSEYYDVSLVNLYRNEPVYPVSERTPLFFLREKKTRFRKSICGDVLKLHRWLNENHVAVLMCLGRAGLIVSSLAVLGTRTKLIFAEHNTLNLFNYHQPTGKGKLMKRLQDFCICHIADKIVTLTDKERENYLARKWVAPSKLAVIPNFMDARLQSSVGEYHKNSSKIITVGRIDFQKGHEYLLQTAKIVLSKHPDWEWHIYGDGEEPYKSEVLNLAERMGLTDKVKFMGNRKDIYDLYKEYAFYVCTSRYEGLPLTLMEAQYNRLPVVSFDIYSGPSDIIRDGVNGYLVKPFDIEAMAEKVNELIEHPELRVELSKHTHDDIEKFSVEKVMADWKECLDNWGGCNQRNSSRI